MPTPPSVTAEVLESFAGRYDIVALSTVRICSEHLECNKLTIELISYGYGIRFYLSLRMWMPFQATDFDLTTYYMFWQGVMLSLHKWNLSLILYLQNLYSRDLCNHSPLFM